MSDRTTPSKDQIRFVLGNLTPRDWPEDFELENGNYECVCYACKATFIGYKRRIVCKACHNAKKGTIR